MAQQNVEFEGLGCTEECNCRISAKTLKPLGGLGPVPKQDSIRSEQDSIREARGRYYGPSRRNHESIGQIWAGILGQAVMAGRWSHGTPIPPEIVCLMMVGVKLSREAYNHLHDNVVDARNYLDFVEEMSDERSRPKQSGK